jgi:ATP-binding cassette subfamily F protein uup
LRAEIAAAHAKLDDGTYYARDPKGFAATSTALHTAEAALATAEEEWLTLEILREEIETGG